MAWTYLANILLLVIIILLNDVSLGEKTPQECVNPIAEFGYCFELLYCRSLFNILKEKPIDRQKLRFLQKSTCGFGNRNIPNVCCTNETDIENWKVRLAKGEAKVDEIPPPKNPSTTTVSNPSPASAPPPPPTSPSDFRPGHLRVAFNLQENTRRKLKQHPNFNLLPSTDNCGLALTSNRIIGGHDADLGQFPWMVLLAFVQDEGNDPPQYGCGGTLISSRYILTASHCVTNLPAGFRISYVRIGEYNTNTGEDCVEDLCSDPVQDIPVEEVISHKDYDKTKKKENDIALVRLKKPAELGSFVTPICLPFELDLKNTLPSVRNITKLTAAGWGRLKFDNSSGAPVLQEARISLVPTPACNLYYKEKVRLNGVDDTRFCAGGEENVDTCRGDSGGPLMEPIPLHDPTNPHIPMLRVFQFGVVSLGPAHCGSKNQPGLYTKVSHYLNWILDNIGK